MPKRLAEASLAIEGVRCLILVTVLCLIGRQDFLYAYDQGSPPFPQLMSRQQDKSVIVEDSHDSWLHPGTGNGFYFEGRRVKSQLTLASLAALSSSLISQLPVMAGASPSSLTARLFQVFPVLGLPVYYLWHRRSEELNKPEHTYQIKIADHHTLAEMFSINLTTSPHQQRLIFKTPPRQLYSLPFLRHGKTSHLYQLAHSMRTLNANELTLIWNGGKSGIEMRISQPEGHSFNVHIPPWGRTLYRGDGSAKANLSNLPELLAFLQPLGLERIISLLQCFIEQRFSPDVCSCGKLSKEYGGNHISFFRFQPKAPFQPLAPLKGKRLGHRFILPLPPCQENTECAMALTWSLNMARGENGDLPNKRLPMFVYSMPKKVSMICRRPPYPVELKVTHVSPWKTDLFTAAHFAGLYLISNMALRHILASAGIGHTALAAGGNATLLAGLGHVQYDMFGDLFYDQYQGLPSNALRPSPPPRRGKRFFQPTVPPEIVILQAGMLEAIGRKTLPTNLHKEIFTEERTRTHTGNNCFINATLDYLSDTITEEELETLEKSPFVASHTDSRELNETERPPEESQLRKTLRESFVAVMRILRNQPQDHLPQSILDDYINNFFQSAQAYGRSPEGFLLSTLVGHPGQSMGSLRQHDVQELITQIFDVLGMNNNPASSIVHGLEMKFILGGQPYTKHRTGKRIIQGNQDESISTLPVAMASPKTLNKREIKSFDSLLNHNLLKTEKCRGTNGYTLTEEDKKDMDIPEEVFKTLEGNQDYRRKMILTHPDAKELTHLTLNAVIYRHLSTGEQGGSRRLVRGKLSGITRHLLAGGDTITVPVYPLDMKGDGQKVTLVLDNIIMHTGRNMNLGHYLTATLRQGAWYIKDDMKHWVIKLTPATGSEERTPLELLNSFMQSRRYDPYLLHFRRADLYKKEQTALPEIAQEEYFESADSR